MNKTINHTAIEAESRLVALCIEDISRIDRVDAAEDDFCDIRWKACITEIRAIREREGDVDALILGDAILARLPSLTYSDLISIEASAPLIESYSKIVVNEACKRRLRLGVARAVECLDGGGEIEEALDATAIAIVDATSGTTDSAMTIGRMAEGRMLELGELAEAKHRGDPTATGIQTGIEPLDKILGGIQTGIPTLIAARPAMGKSALALNISEGVAAQGVGVHVFSLEDTRSAYADRVISYHSEVSSTKIRTCDLQRGDLQRIGSAVQKIRTRESWIVDDRSGVTADEIVRSVRRNKDKNKTKLVIVDYIQLLKLERGQNPTAMLSQAINAFGDAAKRDDMAYVVLSQLNRELEKRQDKRPLLSDLKECGTLEERAKCVIMVYRDAVYNPPAEGSHYALQKEREMELLIRKNSNGQTGYVTAEWRPERMRIS